MIQQSGQQIFLFFSHGAGELNFQWDWDLGKPCNGIKQMTNKDLKKRIIEISYKNKLSHIGSCLTAVDIIDEIYAIKKPNEKFILSSGHAGLALYCVIEKYTKGDDLGIT